MTSKKDIYDVIIIGIGPAGLTASIYASRYKLKNLVVGKILAGELANAKRVENYPGFNSISGLELGEKWLEQVKNLGATVLTKEVGRIDKLKEKEANFLVVIDDKEQYKTKALIVATGSERRRLNIPGEKEFMGRGVSYCTTCLPPEEEVVVNNSLTAIGDIGITKKVLTMNGSFQNIKEIMARDYDGKMVEVKTRFFTEPVKLTANHPVLVTKIRNNYHQKLTVIEKPQWKEAGKLENDDALMYPLITKVEDKKILKFSEVLNVEVVKGKVKNNQETHTSLRLKDKILINKSFLRLVGYYLAEGSITHEGVNIYFNKDEKKYIKDTTGLIKEVFSLKPFVKRENNVARICIFSTLVRDLFYSLFGKLAPYKKIPHWMLFLPQEKQAELIKGWYRGDGCIREKDFCIVTTSRKLAYQTRDIFLRFKTIPSLQMRKKVKLNQCPGMIGKRKIRFKHDKYHIAIGGPSLIKMSQILGIKHPLLSKRKRTNRHAFIKNKYLYLPIRQTKKSDYKGQVYNLAVKNNNTFIAKNFIVHNCDSPFFRNKNVVLIGGSDSAVSGAIHTAQYAKKTTIIYRGEKLRAEPIWLEEWHKLEAKGKGGVIYNTNIIKVLGENKVTGVRLDHPYQGKTVVPADGVFVEIGGVPGTTLIQPLGVDIDEAGYVKVNDSMETNIHGLFCAGDMIDKSKIIKQAIIAMGQGARAAASAFKFIKKETAPQVRGI